MLGPVALVFCGHLGTDELDAVALANSVSQLIPHNMLWTVLHTLQCDKPHSQKKSTSEHLFWCFRMSQIEYSIQYLEEPNSTWKDHDRDLEVQVVIAI